MSSPRFKHLVVLGGFPERAVMKNLTCHGHIRYFFCDLVVLPLSKYVDE